MTETLSLIAVAVMFLAFVVIERKRREAVRERDDLLATVPSRDPATGRWSKRDKGAAL